MGYDIGLRAQSYLQPMMFLLAAVYGSFLILIETVTFQGPSKSSPGYSNFRDRLFGKTWLLVDSRIAARENETILPELVAQASGVVVEFGPGSGNQLSRYDPSKVTRIYGVEPNVNLHEALRASIKRAKLDDVYKIVPCAIQNTEELQKYGIELESIDILLSVQVLCSVPQPQEVLRHLYPLLKPGGKMIVYEHIKSNDFVSKLVQNLYNIVWPYALGNCHLNRATDKYVIDSGKWSKIDLQRPTKDDAWMCIPRVSGHLTK